jgi:hypothetical protein
MIAKMMCHEWWCQAALFIGLVLLIGGAAGGLLQLAAKLRYRPRMRL